jgi:hypothetical protein
MMKAEFQNPDITDKELEFIISAIGYAAIT